MITERKKWGRQMELTWSECMFLRGEESIKRRFSNDRKKLIFVGRGFDPRMTVGVETLFQADTNSMVLLVNYTEKQAVHDPVFAAQRDCNIRNLQLVCGNHLDEICIEIWSQEFGATVVHEKVRKVITSELIQAYDEIIVDISAMPRIVSFNLIKHLIVLKRRKENAEKKISILVCENSSLDDSIKSIIATESAQFLQGLNAFTMGMEGISTNIRVWIPVLGLNEETALQKIAAFLQPDETCPVLPFPSANIRREEEIIRRHGIELFNALEVEKRNIIYVPENQPIIMYQKLCNTVNFYESALNPPGGEVEINYVFSSQGSKIMDIGVLMAIIDLIRNNLTVGMAVIETEGYDKSQVSYDAGYNELCCVCLDDNEFAW